MKFTSRILPAFNNLDAVEIAAQGIFHGSDQKARRLAIRRLAQIASHRHAFFIPYPGRKPRLSVFVCKVPAAEKPDDDTRSGGGIDFFSLHRVEDRLAGVLRRPDGRVAGSRLLPAIDTQVRIRRRDYEMFPAFGLRLDSGVLAEEILFFNRR